MRTLIILMSFLIIGLTTNSKAELNISQDQEKSVYICKSSSAKKYHYTKNCRGLKKCKHETSKVTLTDAKVKYKRTLCGWED